MPLDHFEHLQFQLAVPPIPMLRIEINNRPRQPNNTRRVGRLVVWYAYDEVTKYDEDRLIDARARAWRVL